MIRRQPGGGEAMDHGGDPAGTGSQRAAKRPPTGESDGLICELCNSRMYERHCRIICPTCGYQRDCSDP